MFARRNKTKLLVYSASFGIFVFLAWNSILDGIEKSIISPLVNFRHNRHRKYKKMPLVIPEDQLANIPNIKLLNYEDIDPFQGDIMFLVTSHIAFNSRRNSIRNSWGNVLRFRKHRHKYNNVDYKVYFQSGYLESDFKSAQIESRLHRDMLISNRTEDYWDLSRRVMLGFTWALEHCSFNYLIKTDDDVFYNMPNLFKFIYEDPFVLEHKDRIFAGSIFRRTARSIRDPFSKWYVPKEEWPANEYPLFATGMANILSRLIIEKIRPHFDWENPFRLDDVYIGMLVNRANIPGIGIRKSEISQEFYGRDSPRRKCFYRPYSITQHKVSQNWCMERLTTKSIG